MPAANACGGGGAVQVPLLACFVLSPALVALAPKANKLVTVPFFLYIHPIINPLLPLLLLLLCVNVLLAKHPPLETKRKSPAPLIDRAC